MRPRRGVRVIAGTARGRRLVVPPGDRVRPTKDRVKEAVFSALDARGVLAGACVLDLYAGSGALAIEALSRGARAAVLVEQDAAALVAIAQNLDALGLIGTARIVRGDVPTFLAGTPPPEAPFDLVFVDPPYGLAVATVAAAIAPLATARWSAPGSFVVVERSGVSPATSLEVPGLETTWSRTFGDTLVTFLQV